MEGCTESPTREEGGGGAFTAHGRTSEKKKKNPVGLGKFQSGGEVRKTGEANADRPRLRNRAKKSMKFGRDQSVIVEP